MKFSALPLLALLAVPAAASVAEERWQAGLGLNFVDSDSVTYQATGYSARFSREGKAVPSIHVGYRFHDFANSSLSVTGEYQMKARFRTTFSETGAADTSRVAKMQYLAPGIQWNCHKFPGVDLGFGLHYRFMRQYANPVGTGHMRVDNYRPWITAQVGHTFRNVDSRVKPYVALRVASMIGTTDAPGKLSDLTDRSSQARLVRSLAPQHEATIMGGIRF